MPVIVNAAKPHPFLPSLGDPAVIEAERARHQDIRPLEIAILNLMADKRSTERQLAAWLGNTMLQVNLTFVATDDYVQRIRDGGESRNTPASHIRDYYSGWSEIADKTFDGLIVTGTNALQPTVQDETIWSETQKILDWSAKNVFSSLFLCWGAKAALKHFHNIDSVRGKEKLFGLFDHRLTFDETGLLAGFPDHFAVPVSRWKSPRRDQIARVPALEIAADSEEAGPNIMVESGHDEAGRLYPQRVYVLNHPEYETDTLKIEYERDDGKTPGVSMPKHYFPDDNPQLPPRNTWRHTAHLYTNWVKAVYEATPYDLASVPALHKAA